jgi:hypothetical protein
VPTEKAPGRSLGIRLHPNLVLEEEVAVGDDNQHGAKG